MQLYKNFIDGKWIESEKKETIKVDDPATGKIIGEIASAKKTEVDLAVEAAKKSFESRVLVDMPLMTRAKLMRRIADETRKVAKEGGELLCYENGKSIQCVGFITTLNRSAEWLATGKVTQSLPKNFPTKTEVSLAN